MHVPNRVKTTAGTRHRFFLQTASQPAEPETPNRSPSRQGRLPAGAATEAHRSDAGGCVLNNDGHETLGVAQQDLIPPRLGERAQAQLVLGNGSGHKVLNELQSHTRESGTVPAHLGVDGQRDDRLEGVTGGELRKAEAVHLKPSKSACSRRRQIR